ncbi:S8 family serine peptidase [Streptomyces sp. NPDC101151]|uniref:S8 family serine peptidase n=1 Tax=Streptomyces sp. NPDC101151 TaxID=3366115 RepID=UPI003809D67E
MADLEEVAAVTGVVAIHSDQPVKPLRPDHAGHAPAQAQTESRRPDITRDISTRDAADTHAEAMPPLPSGVSGKGVLVGVIDSGIDIYHPALIKPGSNPPRTRIVSLFDFTLRQTPATPVVVDFTGRYDGRTVEEIDPKPTFTGGTTPKIAVRRGREITEAEINAALQANPRAPFVSREGTDHGTHVTGIAAGVGKVSRGCCKRDQPIGVAPDADLAIVRALTKADIVGGAAHIFGQSWLAPGVFKKPAVVNVSLGRFGTAGDGSDRPTSDWTTCWWEPRRPRPDAVLTIRYTERVGGKLTLFEVSSLADTLRSLLTTARPLRPTDLRAAAGSSPGDATDDEAVTVPRERPAAVRTALDALRKSVDAFLRDLTPLFPAPPAVPARGELVSGIDDFLSRYSGLVTTGGGFGMVRSGWGEGIEWRRSVCADFLAAVAVAADRMARSLADADALVRAYDNLPLSTPDEQRFGLLEQAERLLTTTPTSPRPSSPARLRATVAVEDGRTNFAAVTPDSTDLARLVFLEFALVYSNDWYQLPCALPAGTYTSIRGLAVTDVFGEKL